MNNGTTSATPPELPRPIEPADPRERVEDALRTLAAWLRSTAGVRPAMVGVAVGAVLFVGFLIAVATVVLVGQRSPAGAPVEDSLPMAEPVDLVPLSPTAGPVVVHVSGAVHAPNVYTLPGDARIADAVVEAGGATDDAGLERVNLAALVADGQRIFIPRVEQPVPLVVTGDTPAGEDDAPVNLNTASSAQLEELPGVGPATASAIIGYRDQHGPFEAVAELLEVPGIGPAKLLQIEELVVAG